MTEARIWAHQDPRLETPAAWVDLEAFESNVQTLADYFQSAGVGWRPHFKGLRVPALARKQVAAGALGVTCATVDEAAAAAAGGIQDILIANEVVGDSKLDRVARLLRDGVYVLTCIDDPRHVSQISRVAQQEHVQWPVLVDVDVGMQRCGIQPGVPAVTLCKQAHEAEGVQLRGLMAYEGHVESIADLADRGRAIHRAMDLVTETVELARRQGLSMDIVSCGSSITYPFTAHMPVVTEIQAGGAVFMDIVYRNLAPESDLHHALFVRATVISHPTPERFIVDAGRKKMGCVFAVSAVDGVGFSWLPCPVGLPEPVGLPGAKIKTLNAEHTVLEVNPSVAIEVGDEIDFIPGYVDFTVYHHNRLYGVRGEDIEAVWEVEAR